MHHWLHFQGAINLVSFTACHSGVILYYWNSPKNTSLASQATEQNSLA